MPFSGLHLSIMALLCCWAAVSPVTGCTPLTSIPVYQAWLDLPTDFLDLSNKDLCTLPAGAFKAATGQTTINLSNNQLQTIPAGLWNPAMTAPLTVILSYNSISSLPVNAFWTDNDVIVLRADFNPLSCRDWDLSECFCANPNQVVERTSVVACVTPSAPRNASGEVVSYEDMSTITALMVGMVAVFFTILLVAAIGVAILYRRTSKPSSDSSGSSSFTPSYGTTNAETTRLLPPPAQPYESPKLVFTDSTA